MGLDFSHCDARWGYVGFNLFRSKLAREVGIDLKAMVGFGGDTEWKTVKDDIKIFLNHSDCDGHLTPKQCFRVASRMEELIKDWPDLDYDKGKAVELIEGMMLAYNRNEKLLFM